MMENELRVQLPRLLKKELSGQTLKEAARLHPNKLTLNLNMVPLSTATMILPYDDPEVAMHDLVELYNQHGSVGIFRVVDIQPTYGKNVSITLNHALDILNDAVYPGNPAGTETFDGTVSAFLTEILGAQSQKIGNTAYWTLGACADTGTWHKEIAYDNVLEMLKDVLSEHEDYMCAFDFTVFPWKLNIVARDDTVLSEFRTNRNIESCKVTLNDSDLCTRLYLSVTTYATVTQNNQTAGRKSTVTFETHNDTAAQAIWGVVEKTAGIDSDNVPAAQKAAWVSDYFRRHNTPSVQITIDGLDLYEQTGVNIDEMHLGRICRVALPKYDTIFLERVVSITYPDALRQTTRVSVSLANKRQTAEDSIASAQKEAKKAGGSGGKAKQKADNNETEIERQKIIYSVDVEKTDRYFRVLATEQEWNELLQQYETSSQGLLNVTSGDISAAVGRITTVEGKVSTIEGSTLWINRNSIATVTGKMSVDSSGNLVVNEGSGLYVTRNGTKLGVWDNGNLTGGILIGRINGGTGTAVTILASKVDLGDYATVTNLDATNGRIDSILAGTTVATKLYCNTLSCTGNVAGLTLSGASVTLNGETLTSHILSFMSSAYNVASDSNINLAHYHAISVSESNGVVTITQGAAQATAGSDSFNIAGTQFYQDAVSAAEASGWASAEAQFSATSVTKQGTAVSITGLGQAVTVARQGTSTRITKQGTAVSITGLGQAVTVARQGTSVSVTVQGTAVKVNKRGTATSVTIQGSAKSVTPVGTTVYFKVHPATETPTGNWYTKQSGSSGATDIYYTGGSAKTYYEAGSTVTLYTSGSSATYYNAGSAATYYNAGDTATYYLAGSTATYYNAGSTATYYNAGDTATYYLEGSTATYYNAGSAGTYYVKTEQSS